MTNNNMQPYATRHAGLATQSRAKIMTPLLDRQIVRVQGGNKNGETDGMPVTTWGSGSCTVQL